MPHHAKLPLWDDKSAEQKLETLRVMVDDLYSLYYTNTRKRLLDILEKAVPYDDYRENASILRMKQMVKLYPNIMMSNCEVGHITGSALIVDNQGRCLLHFHKKLNRWLQVGGMSNMKRMLLKLPCVRRKKKRV